MIYDGLIVGLTLALVGFAITMPPKPATTLLSLTDPAIQTDTPYALAFIASSSFVRSMIGGYQIPSAKSNTQTALFLDGVGANLPGDGWITVAAQFGDSIEMICGRTLLLGLNFTGRPAGSNDSHAPPIALTARSSYLLDFLFTAADNGPRAILVATDPAFAPPSAVP